MTTPKPPQKNNLTKLLKLASFSNPKFYELQRARMPTHNIPIRINCGTVEDNRIKLPRGCFEAAEAVLAQAGAKLTFEDARNQGFPIDVAFHGKLYAEQQAASEALVSFDDGILIAPTGFGKTVIGAHLISERNVNTLIITHREELADQWCAQLPLFLGLPPDSIGRWHGSKKSLSHTIDVAAVSFENVLQAICAKYIVGLTATLTRQDGHHPIVTMQCGPVRHKVNARATAQKRGFEHIVFVRNTQTTLPTEFPSSSITKLHEHLANDSVRNELIFNDIMHALEERRSPLVLTERLSQLSILEDKLSKVARNVIVLKGKMTKKERQQAKERLASIPDEEERVIISTGKYIGEGFDDHRLDTMFLCLPISSKTNIQQYAGRLHRIHSAKESVQVYDYVDTEIPRCQKMFKKRSRRYRGLGYKLLDRETPDIPQEIEYISEVLLD